MVVITQGPGALWAGAITPVAARGVQQVGSIATPQFTAASRHIWDSEFAINENGNLWNYVQNCTAIQGEVTYVSNCPVPNQQRALLEAARSANTGTRAIQNSSKPDNSMWTYHGRSYGVGSTQGLREVAQVPVEYGLLGYTYNETGYEASVDCIRNASANLTFTLTDNVANVDIWHVEGKLPNSLVSEFYPVMNWHRDSLDDTTLLAWAAFANPSSDPKHMVGIVASAMYGNFSNLQCEITFSPRLFSIDVDGILQTIVVSPVGSSNAVDPEPTGHLQSNAVYSLNLLSRMSTSLYVSVLGDTLAYNLETLANTVRALDETTILRATEESFVAMLDNILGIYGGAQTALANETVPVSIEGKYMMMRFGQKSYQWAVVIVNGILLVVLLAEAIRTRGWRGLPRFDPLDFKSVVATASFGSDAIAMRLKKQHERLGSVTDSNGVWFGDSEDRTLGHMKVHLEQGPGDIAIVLSDNDVLGGVSEELLPKGQVTRRVEAY
ncbi:hypothetical protein J4E85_004389 [Alternaria conjuncta]|uniref:uncharacterized protein n=1 Tax=Alternaria conjuncta TaxID=181017 RepID=UPI00221FE3C7|nr:uncharacterized protein J4E85_004389 [Alternaria conjuncta]KAI4931792.1 hypothetical protein J4E85_004389 [Alternaria conjuncta]